ncbi:MAG: radical SAM protein [Candidatus Omnitrophica bacterium]|nr:radical SAM protein [Candidatus Omnitrophota bacterium]
MIGTKKKVVLSGGEPTLKEDLFSIIDMIKKSNNIPILYTNGIKLADQDYVLKLAASGIKKVYLSLDGLDPRTTEVICGDSRYLDFKLKALDNLRQAGKIKVCIAPRIVYGVNESEIANLLNLITNDKTHTIKSIMFIAATRNSGTRYRLPPDTATTPDYLIKNIEEVTDGVLNIEYFSEFNRLRENLNMYLNKFRASIPLSYNRVFIRRVNNKLKQFVDVSDLKDMNFLLENKNYIGFSKYVYKYRQWFKLIRYLYSPTLLEFAFYNIDEIIFIEVVPITDEPLPTLEKRGLMNLVKGKSTFRLYATGPT